MVWELDKSTLQCINYVAYIYTKNELMYRKVAVETIAQGLSGNIQWESAMQERFCTVVSLLRVQNPNIVKIRVNYCPVDVPNM